MPVRRRRLVLLPFASLAACTHRLAHDANLEAPNVVPIHERLVTAGQPSKLGLARLSALGYEAVVYLAPWSVSDAVLEEPRLVADQRMEFDHIPVPFDSPRRAHFQRLSDVLQQRASKKTLVHCQLNLRASTFVFLHRAIVLREDPENAYRAVSQVWSPHGPWQELANALLREAGVRFEVI